MIALPSLGLALAGILAAAQIGLAAEEVDRYQAISVAGVIGEHVARSLRAEVIGPHHLLARAGDVGRLELLEHGIGLGKLAWLEAEHGEPLDLMRVIKRALDPDNLFNPGKVLPG